MTNFFNWLDHSYWGGIGYILAGIIIILLVKKYPRKQEDAWFAGDMKGWAGGLGFIILGIIIIVTKLTS